ncbi:MAG: hypothetical protein HW401_454 [Parcubacteria group bacterium]|nr:hypothetical protein [Parcubacteria group bacterium]
MKINYDKVANAIYFTVSAGKVEKSVRMNDRLVVDMSKDGNVIGIELLDASSKQGEELEKNIRQGVPINIVSSTPVAV